MYVYQCMKSPVITITADTPISEAQSLMRENRIHRLPVIDESGNPIGILSETHLREAIISMGSACPTGDPKKSLSTMPVQEVMFDDVLTISPDAFLSQAVRSSSTHGSQEFLVVDKAGKLVGILTFTDMLRLLVKNIFQPQKNGAALYFSGQIQPEALPDIISILNAHQAKIVAIMNVLPPNNTKEELSIHVVAQDIQAVTSALKDKGYDCVVSLSQV